MADRKEVRSSNRTDQPGEGGYYTARLSEDLAVVKCF